MIIGSQLRFFKETGSTNDEALLLLKGENVAEGTVIYTDFQSSGRGQTGNSWISETGKNLLFSIILYPETISPEEQFVISMAMSLGICDFLDRYHSGSRIKWPNDIFINDDKIAGVLIENQIVGNIISNSVTGIGLNVNQESFPPVFPRPVSLKKAAGRDLDTGLCLKQILSDLDKRYTELLYGDREIIPGEYLSRLYRYKEWHPYRSGSRDFTGMITDVDSSGKITIQEKDGKVRDFLFRELEYII